MEQSKDFEEFLEFLGTKVVLNGWDKFRGGLDHRGSDLTGTHSYYTQFQGNEIMYHVATMMPWNDNDPSRKRHLGNDVVLIVFKDSGNDKFDPTVIRSQFNHIFLVVEKIQGPKGRGYQFEFAYKPGLPPFPPFLAHPPVMPINQETRNFLLTKLINAERQTIKFAKIFQVNMATTNDSLLSDIVKTFSDPKRAKASKDKATTSPSTPQMPRAAIVAKDGEFTSGLDFNKITDIAAVAASTTSPQSQVDGILKAPSFNILPVSVSSTPMEDPPFPTVAAPDPYERLENAVLRALVKEEGIPFTSSTLSYHELAKLYFGEANA
jgi:hypothetical protein